MSNEGGTPRTDASAETVLANAGVFKGHDGLRNFAECHSFWQAQPYGTRLYFDEKLPGRYLHRSILQTAISELDRLATLERESADLRQKMLTEMVSTEVYAEANDLIAALRAELAAALKRESEARRRVVVEDGWLPINSAPYNKTMVALIHSNGKGFVRYGVGSYMPLTGWQGWDGGDNYLQPTHWYPLPPIRALAADPQPTQEPQNEDIGMARYKTFSAPDKDDPYVCPIHGNLGGINHCPRC